MNLRKFVGAMPVALFFLLFSFSSLFTVSSVLAYDAVESAKTYLREHASDYSLKQDLSDLKYLRTTRGLAADTVHFKQTYNGIPVYGAYVSINISRKQNQPAFVTSSYDPYITVASTNPQVTSDTAITKAHTAIGAVGQTQSKSQTELILYPKGQLGENRVYKLAWEVIILKIKPSSNWGVVVDASTAEVLVKFDRQIKEQMSNNQTTLPTDNSLTSTKLTASTLIPTLSIAENSLIQYESGSTDRASVDSNEFQGNSNSFTSRISGDGRYIVFASSANTLVSDDTNGFSDIFIRDLQTGTTSRASLASDGTQANNNSNYPSISSNGRYVVFQSSANNLVPGDTNAFRDIFVRDLQAGTTARISVDSNETQANNYSDRPVISIDGRFVVFESSAFNLVVGDTNGFGDIFVRDLQAGTTNRVSLSSSGDQANNYSFYPSISADGSRVTWVSFANNLVSSDTNNAADVYLRAIAPGITVRVSVASGGGQANDHSDRGTLSSDGSSIAFVSGAYNLVPQDTNDFSDVFVYSLSTGLTTRVSIASDETEANGISGFPFISANGRYVVFDSEAINLVNLDNNSVPDVFIRDLQAGTTDIISVSSSGTQGNVDSFGSSISADGRYVAFASDANNLIPEGQDTNGATDIFIRDRFLQSTGPSGQVFNPNPVVTSNNNTLTDNNDQDSTMFTNQLRNKILEGLDGSGYLRGTYVDLTGVSGGYLPGDPHAFEPSLNFNYTRSDERFEEVMVYYHVDRFQRYIQSLGFNNIFNRPIAASAHYTPCQTAYFKPTIYNPDGTGNGELHFGDGLHLTSDESCAGGIIEDVDSAEDADVIVHEYSHALLHNQVPDLIRQTCQSQPPLPPECEGLAIHEGFGDYWAANLYTSEGGGWSATTVFDWALISGQLGGPRNVINPNHYPGNMTNLPHEDGKIWSASLWQILTSLQNFYLVDKLILDSHFNLTPASRFGEAADSILLTDLRQNGGTNSETITNIFRSKGVLDSFERDNDYTQAKQLIVNDPEQKHHFHSFGDNDWVKIDMTAGRQYTIQTSNLGKKANTILALYGTNGTTLITSNNDCKPPNLYSCIDWTATQSGTYFLRVYPHDTSYTGRYSEYDLQVTSVNNLLQNGSFESDTDNDGKPDIWTKNTKFTRSSAIPALDGSYIGRFFATDNTGAIVTEVVNGLSAGSSYDLSGWVNIPQTSDAFTFKIDVRWRNANTVISTTLIKSYTASTDPASNSGWNEALKNLVAPAGTTNAQVRMVLTNLNATIYVDKFMLTGSTPTSTPTQTPTPVGPTPTRTPTPGGATPTPTPSVSCAVDLTPVSASSAVGSSTTFTATVTNVVGGAITNVIFTTSNVAVASVCGPGAVPCPPSQSSRTDPSSPYSTAATGQSNGSTLITAQVTVAGNPNVCGDTSTLTIGSGASPTPTLTPTRTPTPPTITSTPTPPQTPTPTPPASCVLGNASWQNNSFTNQTGIFEARFSVTPSSNNVDQGDVGFSDGVANAAANLEASIRFNSSGVIRAYNGVTGSYAGSIPYSANVMYLFRIIVNLTSDTYTVYVAHVGGSEQILATNFALRSASTQLNNKAVKQVSVNTGTINVCSFTITP